MSAADKLFIMLDTLCTGLEWNIAHHPTVMTQSDEEALAQAREVLAEYLATAKPMLMPVSEVDVDFHLEAVLRAGGLSLRHYTMAKTLADMRAAMRAAMTTPGGSQ